MITSDILGKISVYDIKKFNLVCSTENYIQKEKKDELKVKNNKAGSGIGHRK
jgi:hypothetical protein